MTAVLWRGAVPIEVDGRVTVRLQRRAASTAAVSMGVSIGAVRVLTFAVNGRVPTVNARSIGVLTLRVAELSSGVGTLGFSVNGKVPGWRLGAGVRFVRGDRFSVRDGRLSESFALRDWRWPVLKGLRGRLALNLVSAGVFALQDVITEVGGLAAEVTVSAAVTEIAKAVGVRVSGVIPAAADTVNPKAKVGERYWDVLQRVLGARSWHLSRDVLTFGLREGRWTAGAFSGVSFRLIRDGRRSTVGVNKAGALVGVVGSGRPMAMAKVETLAELESAAAAVPAAGVMVGASTELPWVLPLLGERFRVVVPGALGVESCEVQSVERVITEGSVRRTTVEAVTVGAVEDRVYG